MAKRDSSGLQLKNGRAKFWDDLEAHCMILEYHETRVLGDHHRVDA